MYANTYTHTHTHTRHNRPPPPPPPSHTQPLSHTQTLTQTHTQTHARTHTHTYAQGRGEAALELVRTDLRNVSQPQCTDIMAAFAEAGRSDCAQAALLHMQVCVRKSVKERECGRVWGWDLE